MFCEWKKPKSRSPSLDCHQRSHVKFAFKLAKGKQYLCSQRGRMNASGPDLHNAGTTHLGRGQDRSKVQVLSQDDAMRPKGILDDRGVRSVGLADGRPMNRFDRIIPQQVYPVGG